MEKVMEKEKNIIIIFEYSKENIKMEKEMELEQNIIMKNIIELKQKIDQKIQ